MTKSNYLSFINILEGKIKKEKRKLDIICIGTNKVVGDSLGPMIGSYLKEFSGLYVYGDMENTICRKDEINKIRRNKNNCTIVVDSAISNVANFGDVFVTSPKQNQKVGICLKKEFECDIMIKCIVSKYTDNEAENFQNLENVDFNKLQELAYIISKGICRATKNYSLYIRKSV